MKYDLYSSFTVKVNDSEEKSTRTKHIGIEQEDMKNKIKEIVENIPEDATEFYLNVEKNWDSQMNVLEL